MGQLSHEETQSRLARLYCYLQVGRCLSGVSHDLNNLLGAILAYAELIKMGSQLDGESARMLQDIMDGVKKCSNLVNNLTLVTRRERPNASVVNLSQLVSQALDVRRHDLRLKRIAVETRFDEGLSKVVVNVPKIEQALICLLSNAIEQLEKTEPRQMRVGIHGVNGFVEIDIWNSAPSVPDEEHEAIFQPFYTTKAEDHLGLGLYLAREIARLHKGDLFYTPKRGFVLRLPTKTIS